jgi:hypothetical protein
MESKNRNVWIIVVVVLILACCCVLAVAAGVGGWFASRRTQLGAEPFVLDARYHERTEQTFEVGATPSLDVTNFAGAVTVRRGAGSTVQVVATKRASRQTNLSRIQVSISQSGGGVLVETRKSFTTGSGYVDLEITAPAGSSVSLDTGAGRVQVYDLTGSLDLHSGAGEIDVQGAAGPTRVDLGAGQIRYQGVPSGECRFQTGAGEIVLRLPAEPDVSIDAGTGLGAVSVDFDVAGSVSVRSVQGVIGTGSQGSIYAHTGVGAVSIRRQ